MLNSQVLDLMLGRLGRRTAPNTRTFCLTELNIAIRELERGTVKPWFMEATATGNIDDEDDFITLPSDFVMEVEEGTFELQHPDNGWTELAKHTREKIRIETKNEDPAFPQAYAIWGNTFLLGPAPDQAYPYRFDYYARTTAIADNSTEASNSWINEFFDLTTSKALMVIARDHIQSDRMYQNQLGLFKNAWSQFLAEVEQRQMAGRTLLLTDEEN
jgi:hypothetical protein